MIFLFLNDEQAKGLLEKDFNLHLHKLSSTTQMTNQYIMILMNNINNY